MGVSYHITAGINNHCHISNIRKGKDKHKEKDMKQHTYVVFITMNMDGYS